MDISTMTVGDLFMEDNYDWVNDEEAVAFSRIEELIRNFIKTNGKKPTKHSTKQKQHFKTQNRPIMKQRQPMKFYLSGQYMNNIRVY